MLFGLSEGGPMSMLFAATYPERVTALVLQGTFARLVAGDDFPIGVAPDARHLVQRRDGLHVGHAGDGDGAVLLSVAGG